MADEGTDKQSPSTAGPADHLKPYWWKKGQSGNPAGRPPGSGKLLKKLEDELSQDGGNIAQRLVDRFLDIALSGEDPVAMKAVTELFNRIEGMAVKRVEVDVVDHKKLVELADDEESDE